MSCLPNPCASSCPPMTVSIQPPPFMVKIPGPSMYCPDRPLCIEQCNPCAPCCPPTSKVSYTSKCFPKPLPRIQSDCYSCQ